MKTEKLNSVFTLHSSYFCLVWHSSVGSFIFCGSSKKKKKKTKNKTWKRKRKGRAARWTSQCFDSLPTAQYSRGSSLSLSDTLLRPIYVCVSPAFSLLVCVLLLPLLAIRMLTFCFFVAYSSHKSLSSLPSFFLLFQVLKKRQPERESSCYAVSLPPHPDLPLCFRVPGKAEIPNIVIIYLQRLSPYLFSKITSCAIFAPCQLLNVETNVYLRRI